MKKLLTTLLLFTVAVFTAYAGKISVTVQVSNASHVTVKTNGGNGRTLTLKSGEQTIELDTETDGPTLAISDNTGVGYVQDILVNFIAYDNDQLGETSYVPINEDLSRLQIVTMKWDAQSRVHLDIARPEQIEVAVDGKTIDILDSQYFYVDKNKEVTIKAAKGCKVMEVTCTAKRVHVKENNGVWSFVAYRNTINVDVVSQIDSEDNTLINIDQAANASVTTKAGRVLELKDGDNYFKLDYDTDSPLTVKPTGGCSISYIICGGDMQGGNQTSYLVDLVKNGFSEITIATEYGAESFRLFVDNGDAIKVETSTGRVVPLKSGGNKIELDFSTETPVTISAADGVNILSLTYNSEPVTPNAAGKYVIDVVPDSRVSVDTDAPEDNRWITIVDEDFSRLTSGSEESPDRSKPLLDEAGYAIDPSSFAPYDTECTKGWGGQNFYPAGGAMAVLGGFINTPTGDYSGPLKMTFRAKLMPGQGFHEKELRVALVRRSTTPEFRHFEITLTEEWQTFEIEASNGYWRDCMFQMVDPEVSMDFNFLVDDFKIEHRIVSIEPPQATEPFEMEDKSFIASWKTTPTAEEYLVSVYAHLPNDKKIIVDEDFEDINTDANGNINQNNPNYPENWDIDLNSGRVVGTAGSKAILLENGDRITAPMSDYPLTECKITAGIERISDPDALKGTLLKIMYMNGYDWYEWMSINFEDGSYKVGDKFVWDLTPYVEYWGAEIYSVRLEFISPNNGVALSIDGLNYVAPFPPDRDYLWEDHVVKGNETHECLVTDENFDPAVTYYYRIKARNSQFTSAESNEVEVYNVNTPIVKEPTNVTWNSYTANWDCGPKADYFVVRQVMEFEADKDADEFDIISEDFSRIKSGGDVDSPEVGEYTTVRKRIDQYTDLGGWMASSYGFIDGGMVLLPKTDGYMAGSICTPVLDLSHNGGTAYVKYRAYAKKGEHIVFAGNMSSTAYEFPETGWMEHVGEVYLCGDKENITIYSGEYEPLYIDYVTIYQPLKAGDKIRIRTKDEYVMESDARSWNVEDVYYRKGYNLGYCVAAYRFDHDNTRIAFESLESEVAWVDPSVNSVEETLTDNVNTNSVTAIEEGLKFELGTDAEISIYSVDGRLVKSFSAAPGNYIVAVPNSIYVVKINENSTKVVVK